MLQEKRNDGICEYCKIDQQEAWTRWIAGQGVIFRANGLELSPKFEMRLVETQRNGYRPPEESFDEHVGRDVQFWKITRRAVCNDGRKIVWENAA